MACCRRAPAGASAWSRTGAWRPSPQLAPRPRAHVDRVASERGQTPGLRGRAGEPLLAGRGRRYLFAGPRGTAAVLAARRRAATDVLRSLRYRTRRPGVD